MSSRTPLSASWRELPSAGLPSAGIVSPHPGFVAVKTEEKTPITPPLAYMDFLKAMSVGSPAFPSPSMASPPLTGKHPLNRTSTAGSTASNKTDTSASSEDSNEEERDEREIESGPSTATSVSTDVSCNCDPIPKSAKAAVPASPFANYPLSAPLTGPAAFPSMKIPPSPITNTDSPVRSPFSARSVKSPFDWEAALKARRYADAKSNHSCGKSSSSRTSVRHIREVVTRTVTYTPRMQAAPKGKRRKVEKEAEA